MGLCRCLFLSSSFRFFLIQSNLVVAATSCAPCQRASCYRNTAWFWAKSGPLLTQCHSLPTGQAISIQCLVTEFPSFSRHTVNLVNSGEICQFRIDCGTYLCWIEHQTKKEANIEPKVSKSSSRQLTCMMSESWVQASRRFLGMVRPFSFKHHFSTTNMTSP